jgi:hypothetical protein
LSFIRLFVITAGVVQSISLFITFAFDDFQKSLQNFSLIRTFSNLEISDLPMVKDEKVNIAVT